jgi:tryptophan-rich sensory protein
MIGNIISILIAQTAGLIGSAFTMPAISTWYDTLAKPSFTPPAYVFGPAWAVLYTLMGLAAYRIWEKKTSGRGARLALGVYVGQLALNVMWSYAFFGLRSPIAGLGIIALLWIAIFATMILFYRVDKNAGWLLVPYIVWVSFAATLNYAVWMLN